MKKTALVLGLFVFTLNSCDKHDSVTRPKNYRTVVYTENDNLSKNSQHETSSVQLHNAGMSQIKFVSLLQALGNIDVGNFAIENNTEIVLVESLNHNVNVKGFNKMIDNFNSLYDTNNEALMQSYQSYADQYCKKIYGCVGTIDDIEHDWKIIKFLPNPEKCNFEPTITMSNVML
jgi:hypothetical protein